MKDNRLKQIHTTLEFLRSMILGGEPMTDEIRNAINKAIDNVNNVDIDLQTFQSYEIE